MTNANTILLTLLSTIVLLGGCANRNNKLPGVFSAEGSERGEWLCEAGKSSDDWDCIQSEDIKPKLAERAARKPTVTPAQPPAVPSGPDFGDTQIEQSSGPLPQSSQPLPQTLPQTLPEPVPQNLPQALPQPTPQPNAARRPQPEKDTPLTTHAADKADKPSGLPTYAQLAYRPPDPVRIIDLPEQFYAAQLLAVSTKKQIEDFVIAQDLYNMSAARIERDGQFLYVLLLGVYETEDNARLAVASMPEEVQQMKPWVRPIGGLQEAMLKADRLASTASVR